MSFPTTNHATLHTINVGSEKLFLTPRHLKGKSQGLDHLYLVSSLGMLYEERDTLFIVAFDVLLMVLIDVVYLFTIVLMGVLVIIFLYSPFLSVIFTSSRLFKNLLYTLFFKILLLFVSVFHFFLIFRAVFLF